MARYQALVGKQVEAHYRTSDIQLSVTGTLVSDSGKSVFVEERFSQSGKSKTMRVEIPYEFILRIVVPREEARTDSFTPAKSQSPAQKKRT
jgi:hypothetical protein